MKASLQFLFGEPGPRLPKGVIGRWKMGQYSTTPSPYVVNAAASNIRASSNLLRAPRRLFNNTAYWNKNAVVVTDDYAPDQNGASDEASRLVGTGSNWFLYTSLNPVLSAGTYAVRVWARSSTALNQTFKMKFDTAGNLSAAKTATPIWQPFIHAATLSAGAQRIFPVCSDGTNDADIEICDVSLLSGGADIPEPPLAGHLYLGFSAFDAAPAYSAGYVDFSTGGYGLAQFPATIALSEFTCMAFVRKVANAQDFGPILSRVQNFADFSVTTDRLDAPFSEFGGDGLSWGQNPGFNYFYNQGWFCFTQSSTVAVADQYVNDIRQLSAVRSTSSVSIRDLWAGVLSSTGNSSDYEMAEIVLWPRRLTAAEQQYAFSFIARGLSQYGIAA